MEILKWLDQAEEIEHYEVQDFRQWAGGSYYKIKVVFIDQSTLFAREYADEIDRNYSFHWQDINENLIVRWDNAPHHNKIATFPHHKHDKNETIVASTEITAKEVLEIIQTKVTSQ